MVSTKPGTYSGVPGMAWKGTLRKPLPRYRDEPRDDTGDRDENRALAR
jgi:hypothetical protein